MVRAQRVDATLSDLEVVLMRQGRRCGLSAEQKADIWQRWETGCREELHYLICDTARCDSSVKGGDPLVPSDGSRSQGLGLGYVRHQGLLFRITYLAAMPIESSSAITSGAS